MSESESKTIVCPGCGVKADADAAVCVNCGTNLASGKTPSGGVEETATKEKMSVGRMMVGVISVLVIVGAGVNVFLKFRGNMVTKQSTEILYALGEVERSQNFADVVARFETLVAENTLANNHELAVEALEKARKELEQVPERTAALAAAIEQAQHAATQQERVAILSKAIGANRGATNLQAAKSMLEDIRRSD